MILRNQTFRRKDKNTIVLHIHGAPQQVMQTHFKHQAKCRWSLIRAVFHHEGLSLGQSFIWKVSHQGSLSSGKFFIMAVSHLASLSSSWRSFIMMKVSHQGSLSSWWRSLIWAVFHHDEGLSSGQSFIWKVFHYGSLSFGQSFNMKVSHQSSLLSVAVFLFLFYQGGLSTGQSFTRVVSHLGSLSSPSGWSFIRVVSHQGGLSSGLFYQGGLSILVFSSLRVITHRVVSHQDDLTAGWFHLRVVSHQGRPVIQVASYTGGLIITASHHSGWSLIRDFTAPCASQNSSSHAYKDN